MNALTTALRVLWWAAEGKAPAPGGPLLRAAELASPDPELCAALSRLVQEYAARSGAGRPPFGDAAPAGAGALLLAAAIGGRMDPDSAHALAQAVPPPQLSAEGGGWADALARHAVAAPFVGLVLQGSQPFQRGAAGRSLADARGREFALCEVLLDVSPLTAVLHRPSSRQLTGGAATVVRTAAALLTRARGRPTLCAGLAAWYANAEVLDWRSQLLSRLSHAHPEAVLDTYLAARLRHGPEWDRRVLAARRRLAERELPDPLTLATLRFWAPLAALGRGHPRLLSTRPLLDGHQPALDLVRRYQLTPSATG